MSTKSSIAIGDNFHFYKDFLYPKDVVCLELENIEFETNQNRVMVAIPIEIWSCIREYSLIDLSLVNLGNEEIRATAQQEVDSRIARYQNASTPESARYFSIVDFTVMGDIESPRQQQIEQRVDYLTNERERQQQLQSKIEYLRQINHKP